jgi:hypothetical protein
LTLNRSKAAWRQWLSFTHDSWTAPLDVQRVQAGGKAHAVAAAQIWELVERLPADGPVPLFVFDAGYDPEALARELGELDGEHVAVLDAAALDQARRRLFDATHAAMAATADGHGTSRGSATASNATARRCWRWPSTSSNSMRHGRSTR